MKSFFKVTVTVVSLFGIIAGCNNSSSGTSENKEDTSMSQSKGSAKDSSNQTEMNKNMGSANHMTAMNSMIDKMKNMNMTGDFDVDFANMMIEHHQGAIDMSEQELNAGKDEKIKSMAQNIIDKQKKEIQELHDFVNSYKPSGMKHGEGDLQKSMNDMESKMKGMSMSGDTDKDFVSVMISHHQGAIDMAKMEQKNGMSAKLKQMAQTMINDQNKEIKDFNTWLDSHK